MLSFKRGGKPVPVAIIYLVKGKLESAKELQDRDTLSRYDEQIESVRAISNETTTPTGWSATLTGKSKYGTKDVQIYMQLVRIADQALLCNVRMGGQMTPITAGEATAVCSSLAQ